MTNDFSGCVFEERILPHHQSGKLFVGRLRFIVAVEDFLQSGGDFFLAHVGGKLLFGINARRQQVVLARYDDFADQIIQRELALYLLGRDG